MDTPITEVVLPVVIVSDFTCPWCYIGKWRVAAALRQLEMRRPEVTPDIRWLPHQLNPDLPAEGITRAEHQARKTGVDSPGKYEGITMVGNSVGIPFAFDKIEMQPNTLNAHRLMHYAEQQGREHAVAEALFQAFFIAGGNLSDLDTLAAAAERGGLDRAAARAYLAGDADTMAVIESDGEIRRAGVDMVPFFIFNRAVTISGAQTPDALVDAMLQSLETRSAQAAAT